MKNLKSVVVASSFIALLGLAQTARADGFLCGTDDRELEIQVYQNTLPALGTRNIAVMVMADETLPEGHRLIAKFDESNSALSNTGASYVAQVTTPPQEVASDTYVSDLPLNQIERVEMDVAFTYSNPAPAGQSMPGVLTITTYNGQQDRKDLYCIRYLKN
jgi:hypothetical protein